MQAGEIERARAIASYRVRQANTLGERGGGGERSKGRGKGMGGERKGRRRGRMR